ncbi:ATP-dependent DNA helicase PcrA [Rickettsiales endosymbiont of Paramecium tredecaurelia]|uniref:ATP-dependent helicase n=1 Tax=Candidatus Sarmatiella mevalonica TaxID=2770581 RepID=UPI0019221BE5|nr:UvrD-helicase domain-containing protein [Candidatus Sarmatiella mevalonica]MBL3284529.1 ATP-dependent DNA helicase PcrA [Candidatus Sarmatiella mevalonica]
MHPPFYLEEDFFANLNQKQLQAATHRSGPLLVLAGAGTGKTKVITSRILYLLQQGLARPENILAVTFTNKAAREMKSRLQPFVDAQSMFIGTFHSICARILRAHVEHLDIGLNKNFTIIDAKDQIALIKQIQKQKNIDAAAHVPKEVLYSIERWKDQGLQPNQVEAVNSLSMMHRQLFACYQNELIKSNLMDFGDLLLYSNWLFNNPEVLDIYQQKYLYLFVDEYQDTNKAQYDWICSLAKKHRNICCVGDDDQSIYGWRGAQIENILSFSTSFPDAQIIKLEQNYRSTCKILQAAASLINYNATRHTKTLWTERETDEKIKLVSCYSDKDEAHYIASVIKKKILIDEKSSIGILVRAGFQTRVLEEAFMKKKIAYTMVGGVRFYERAEIKDVLAYIRLALNLSDSYAFSRIINMPKRGIGNSTIDNISGYAFAHNVSLFHAASHMLDLNLFTPKISASLKKFIDLIHELQARYKEQKASVVTKYLIEVSGYLAHLAADGEENAERKANLNEMCVAIDELDDISVFMQHASLLDEEQFSQDAPKSQVNVMTLHASKGLEFDIVFLPGWEEGVFPSLRSQNINALAIEEERRLGYVGITRAKKDLYISYAQTRNLFNAFVSSRPSRFLKEMPDSLFEKLNSFDL